MARSAPTFLETLYRDLREAHEDYHKAYADQNWEYARYLRDDYIPKISGILGEHWRDLQDSKLLFDEITVEAKTFFLLFYYVLVRVQFSEQQTEIIHEGHLYNEPLQIVPNRVERVNDFFHSPGSPKLVKFRLLCENVYKAQEQKSEISRKLEAFRWKLFDCQREIFGSEPRTFAPLPPIPETIPPLIIINGQPRNAIRNPARLLEYKTPLWDFKTLRLIDHFRQLHVILELSPEQIAYFEPRRETWHTPIYEYAPKKFKIVRDYMKRPGVWSYRDDIVSFDDWDPVLDSLLAFQWKIWNATQHTHDHGPQEQPAPDREELKRRILGEDDEN